MILMTPLRETLVPSSARVHDLSYVLMNQYGIIVFLGALSCSLLACLSVINLFVLRTGYNNFMFQILIDGESKSSVCQEDNAAGRCSKRAFMSSCISILHHATIDKHVWTIYKQT